MYDRDDYRLSLRMFKEMGKWVTVPLWFLKVMSMEEALLLADLLNIATMREAEEKVDPDGWFLCTSSTIKNRLEMTQRVQERLFRQLEDRGFIHRTMKGNPARRFLRLDYDELEHAFDSATSEIIEL